MVHCTNRKEIGPQLEINYLPENNICLVGALQKFRTLCKLICLWDADLKRYYSSGVQL